MNGKGRDPGVSIEGTVIAGGKCVAVYQVPKRALFGLDDAAEFLGLGRDTLRNDADAGHVPCYAHHGRRTFKLEDLEAVRAALPKWRTIQQPENLREAPGQCQNGDRPNPASSGRTTDGKK